MTSGTTSPPATTDTQSEINAEIAADARQWVAFTDGDGDTWMFDLSFLTSNWTCIYGAGCLGIGESRDAASALGCCIHGAHFIDDDDHMDTLASARRLSAAQWQHRPPDVADAFAVVDDVAVTTTVDGACIFLNRPGFAGGVGCALHLGASSHAERPLDWKPDVCWQVPLRLDEHVDDNGHRTWRLRGWERRDWGAGGADFDWWCTDEHDAFVGNEMVLEALRDEIVELVGADAYAILLRHLDTLDLRRVVPQPGSVPVELRSRR